MIIQFLNHIVKNTKRREGEKENFLECLINTFRLVTIQKQKLDLKMIFFSAKNKF